MLPLTDFVRPRRFPFVTLALVAANLVVFVAYQLPHGLDRSVDRLGFRPCEVSGACHDTSLAWPLQLATSMFAHGGWAHVIGNLVFLVALGLQVEDLLGPWRYLGLYLVAGLAANALEGGLLLAFAPARDATYPRIGASGAISGVVGAYVVAFPFERILVWLLPIFFLRVPAIGLLGVWLLLQAFEGSYVLSDPSAVVGVSFFAHVGGFLAGAAAAALVAPGAIGRLTAFAHQPRPSGPRAVSP